MNKILILGSAGMAGHVMAEYFSATDEYEISGIDITESKFTDKIMDVTQFEILAAYIKDIKPLYVINCIGVLVEKSSSDIKIAILINSYLPHFLSELGNNVGYKLIHLSTDCVFSGKEGNYSEGSFRNGDDNYSRTKALGEVINNKDLTIRTSIIGPEINTNGTGLFEWFLKQKQEINGFTNAYWSGVTTVELAKATYEFIKQDINGLYHLCPKEKISKYDLLRLLSKNYNSDIVINKYDNYTSDKSLINTRGDFVYHEIVYVKMIDELFTWTKEHSELYPHHMVRK